MKLLLVADAVAQTGFARVTHNIVPALIKQGWEVHLLGINYLGDPHEWQGMAGLKIYPALLGGDTYGLGRLSQDGGRTGLIREIKPDVIMIINDPWCVRDYLGVIPPTIPVVAYMPVDAPNQEAAEDLNGLARAIAYTRFGRKELILGGFNGRCDIIPHGVDTELYKPMNRMEARARVRFKHGVRPEDAFIVMNVNRNAPRKRLDLTIQYWTQWWINAGQPKEAFLYLHCANRDEGWNVINLAKYFGIEKQFILTNPNMSAHNCMFERDMPLLYNIGDLGVSTTLGEGWGLTTHEGMACGIPQLVPRYSALGEWADGAVEYVDCTSFSVTPRGINTVGGVADMQQFIAAIDKYYRDRDLRATMGLKALERAKSPDFSWTKIGEQFHLALLETVVERQRKPMGIQEAPQNG